MNTLIRSFHDRPLWTAIVCLIALATAGCGSTGNVTSADANDIVVHGTVMGIATTSSARASSATTSSTAVVVTVQQNPAISTVVASDGSFTLRGLPPGDVTLVFTSGGITLGTVSLRELAPNQEVTLVVQVDGGGVRVIDEQRTGIGHGDVELEGTVAAVLSLQLNGDSRFLIDGRTVIARPGETAIREGQRSRSVTDVTIGRRVHVKGVWAPAEGGTQPVLAQEIILQGESSSGPSPTPNPNPGAQACDAVGSKVEVEGPISAKGGSDITVNQQGQGLRQCFVGSGTTIRKGNKNYNFSELQVGWRVHVKGPSLGSSGGMCQVQAQEIMVQ